MSSLFPKFEVLAFGHIFCEYMLLVIDPVFMEALR